MILNVSVCEGFRNGFSYCSPVLRIHLSTFAPQAALLVGVLHSLVFSALNSLFDCLFLTKIMHIIGVMPENNAPFGIEC